MPGLDTLHTARLIAERLRGEHLDALLAIESDRSVRIWLGEPVVTRASVQARLADHLEHWERFGYGSWLVRETVTGQPIGRCGLRQASLGERPMVELLYAIRRDFWGRGLASEMAAETVRVAFDEIELSEVAAWTLWNNWASRRVMDHAGLHYVRDIIHARLPHVLYRATASQWFEGHSISAARR